MSRHFSPRAIFLPALIVAIAASFVAASFVAAADDAGTQAVASKEPGVAMILSTGDNLFYYKWFPIDSPLGIRASFDLFKSRYNVNRIMWRGAQAQWMTNGAVFRPESEEIADLYAMEMKLETKDHLTPFAAGAAKRRGLSFWGYMPFFEVGASADVVSMSGFGPYNFEDKFRATHPEYRLYDRAGIESGGTIEFGYPAVRQYFVKRYEDELKPGGDFSIYGGIIFYTYVENFFPRFTDQFIYSDIAAKDFKARYGVDVYSEPFDMDKYMQLRGEYVTEYLRELRRVFDKYGKKIAFYIDARDPEVPMHWPSYPKILTPGRIKMDWRTWVKEGLVDEIALRDVRDIGDVQPFLDATRGTKTRVSIVGGELRPSMRYLYNQGVTRQIWSPEMPSGFPAENSPVSALEGNDRVAKLSVLRQVRDGSLDVPVAKIVELFNDPDLIIRRQAVAAAVGRRMTDAIPALEKAAMSPENNFRCNVIDALGTLNGPNTVAVIGQALGAYPFAGTRLAARTAWSAMFPDSTQDLVSLYHRTTSPYVRTAIIEMLVSKRAVPAIEAIPAFRPLVNDAAGNQNATLRSLAAFATAYYPDRESAELLLKLMDDPSDVVQNAAVFSSGQVARCIDDKEMRDSIFQKLLNREKLYGAGSNRDDQDWGYRVVDEALIFGFGPRGEHHVVDVLNGDDPKLADEAWRVLFHPNDGWNFYPIDRESGEALYAYHPGPNRMNVPHQKYTLPAQVELLSQNFADFKPGPLGETGDIWSTGGKWTGLDDNVHTNTKDGKPFVELGVGSAGQGARLIGTIAYDMPDKRLMNRLRGHFPNSPLAYGVADGVVELSFDILKSDRADALQVSLSADTAGKQCIGFVMAKDGQVQVRTNGGDPVSVPSLVITSKDGWRHFTLRFDFSTGKAVLVPGDGQGGPSGEFSFDTDKHYHAVVLAASGDPDTATQFGNLHLTQLIR
jgi:hypothetical protein